MNDFTFDLFMMLFRVVGGIIAPGCAPPDEPDDERHEGGEDRAD
jgi:hypothetical protein